MSLGLHCGCCKLCLSGCLHSCVVAWGLHVLTGRAYGTTVRCRQAAPFLARAICNRTKLMLKKLADASFMRLRSALSIPAAPCTS